VTAPSWRADIHREEDIVEEIARVWGYDRIPEAMPIGAPMGSESPEAAFLTSVKAAMIRLGFTETLHHTLSGEQPLDLPAERVMLRHPLSPELSMLRCSLLPGLAHSGAKNRARDLSLFEVGNVFHGEHEFPMLGFLIAGHTSEPHWQDSRRPDADFYTAKGIVEQLLAVTGRTGEFEPSTDARLHPTRQARLVRGGEELAVIGQVRDDLVSALDLPKGTVVGEVDLKALLESDKCDAEYEAISHFPAIRRDFSMSIPKGVEYATIAAALSEAAGSLAESVTPLSVFEGKGVEAGERAIAVSLSLRHGERTLTDEEANAIQEAAWRLLEGLGARRR
jgi:phenylalanyl-tRNA synthetase beta chain